MFEAATTALIGILGVSAVLLFFGLKIDQEYALLRLFTVTFAITLLLLVPKVMVDAQTVCEVVVTNSTDVSASVTSYEYGDHCYQRDENTPSTFWKALGVFWFLFFFYVLLYIFFKPVEQLLKWKKKGKGL